MDVEFRDEKITMKTYRVLGEDPLPKFFEGYYPYTGLNRFDDEAVPVDYGSVVVENEFLKMRVIPTLGARLYDLYDKVNGAHVFHYNETVRPAMIALRGAWIPTGMEFNSVHKPHHTADNFSPVDLKVERNLDGSVTAWIGNHNLVTGIYWSVGLTLRPGRQFLETAVKTFNGEPLHSRYYFWTNSAESVGESSRVFIPGKRTQSGSFPVSGGVDVSWYKNCKFPVDAFVIDSEEDFFGFYDYETGRGVVHYANHHVVPGKKRFTWGTSEDGLFWAPILSDKGVPYIELQSGRFRTQSIVEFIDPHFSEEWVEWWYPIAKVGGITFANKDAALNLVEKKGRRKRSTFVGIYATGRFRGAKVRIDFGKDAVEEAFDLSPGNPFVKNYVTGSPVSKVEVAAEDGGEILTWDCRDYRTKVDESVFLSPKDFAEASTEGFGRNLEELFVDAALEEKRGDKIVAELKYRRLLEFNARHPKALSSLAALHYRKGEYGKAIQLLERAVKVDPVCDRSRYLLGLAYLKAGDCGKAEPELWKARRTQRYFSPACFHIAQIKAMGKRYFESGEVLAEGIGRNPRDARSLFLHAAVLRRLGRAREGLEVAKRALDASPLYYPAISEVMMCSKGTEEFFEAESEFKRVVLAKDQKVLEVAKEYVNAGLFDDATEILAMAVRNGVGTAMVHYYLGFAHEKAGMEEEEILRNAKELTGHPAPGYYLGNLLFFLGRFDEAVVEWEEAKRKGMRYWVLRRNLGYAYHKLRRDGKRALGEYEEAIKLCPSEPGLYLEHDEVCSHLGMTGRRIAALEAAREKLDDGSISARLASAYVEAGEYDEALEILESSAFTPAEGYHGYWDIYVDALVRRGAGKVLKGKHEEALADFKKALEYPRNLGIGAPYAPYRHEAAQRYWLGECYHSLGMEEKSRKAWKEVARQKRLTPSETYYKALALERLGRKEEARRVLRDSIEDASRIERAIMGLKGKLDRIRFNYLGYDLELAARHCAKMAAYLGLRRRKDAAREFRKARLLTKNLGHYAWIYEVSRAMSKKRAKGFGRPKRAPSRRPTSSWR
ncbi:MAG: DUF5107 domain-containing protein [Candidatus Brockarchaeota archaeon]|nr:DUF5107 domain-containing protein [Candidatus Brockarchaeota archaeon]